MRIGVYGLGRIGLMHARNAALAAGVSEVALIGRDAGRVETARASVQAMLDNARAAAPLSPTTAAFQDALGQLDGVIVATATSTHADLARVVAASGTPLLIEKPLALEAEELQSLADELEATGTPIMVAFQRRYDPGYQALRQRVQDGDVGPLRAVASHNYDRHPLRLEYIPDSRGMWIDLLVHDFDAITWVTGDDVVEVSAHGSVLDEPTYEQYQDADTCTVLLKFASGAVGTATGLRRSEAGQDCRLEVVGTRGAFAVGIGPNAALTSTDPEVAAPKRVFDDFEDRFQPAFRAEMAHFVRMVRGEVPSLTPPSAGLAATRIAEAAASSFRSGRPVRIG